MMRSACFVFCCALGLAGAHAHAVGLDFEITYTDPPGFGFNDTRTAPPAPGNPGTTYGQQRRIAFERALADWSDTLISPVSVRLDAGFQDLGCTGFAAIGSELARFVGGSNTPFPFPDTFIGVNLANARAGTRLTSPGVEFDARVRFNLLIDDPDACPNPRTFWYGLDPDAPVAPIGAQVAFYALALHEIAHTIGFNTWTNVDTGEFSIANLPDGPVPLPSLFDHFLFDLDANQLWVEMQDAERAASARNEPGLVWSGEAVTEAVEQWAILPPRLQVVPAIDGNSQLPVLVHGFPPYLQVPGLSAELALAEPADACAPLTNAADLAGRVALFDRGGCFFSVKQANTAAAGAVAAIMADSLAPGDPNAIQFHTQAALDDPDGIPFYSVDLPTGNALKDALPGLQVTLDADPALDRLGTNDGFITHHGPSEIQPGSSVIHFSNRVVPHSVMRTGPVNQRFGGGLDVIGDLMADIGWSTFAVEVIFADGFEGSPE